MKFVVDTSDVTKGLRDYKAAVEGIFASLDKFEAKVKKTMDGVAKAAGNQTNVNKFKKSLEAFGNVKIDTGAARKLSALSQALQGFKAPSAAQSKNTVAFFRSLGGLPDLGAAMRSVRAINDIKVAMAGFKAPSDAQTQRLREFAKGAAAATRDLQKLSGLRSLTKAASEINQFSAALKNLKVPTAGQVTNLGNFALAFRSFNFSNMQNSGNFYAALAAIGNFRAPSAAQIRNLQAFVTAVGQMRVPQNAGQIADYLTRIANAAAAASGSLGRFRAGLGPLGGALGRTGDQAQRASLQMMGLQNAFSGTFQIGSVLRSLLGSLTIAELGRNFFEAANQAETFRAQMSVISEDAGFAQSQLNWVSSTASKMGIDLLTAQAGFGKLSIAADKAGLAVGQTREIFTGFGMAMTVLGTSVDRQNDVFLAMQQVMSKGYLSAEELNQQLNEHLPVARGYATEFANNMGLSLEEALKKKAIGAADILQFMAKRMEEDFGPAMEKALNRPATQMTILRGRIDRLFQIMGQSGAAEGVVRLLKEVTGSLDEETVLKYGKAWGEYLYNAFERVREAFVMIRDNWDQIKGPLLLGLEIFAKYMIVTGALQIGRFFVTPMIDGVIAVRRFLPLMWDLVAASRALTATNMAGFIAQLRLINSPAITSGVITLTRYFQMLQGTMVGRGLSGIGRMLQGVGSAASRAAPLVGRLAAAIGTGLSVAWLAGERAASDSLGKQVTLNYSAVEIIVGGWTMATSWIGDKWDEMTTWISENMGWLVNMIGTFLAELPGYAAEAALGITYVFNKAVEGLVRLFAAGFATIGNTLSMVAGAVTSFFAGDFEAAGAKAFGLVTGQAMIDGFRDSFKGFQFNMADYGSFKANTGRGFNFIMEGLNEAGAVGRARLAKPARPKPSEDFQMASDAEYEKLMKDLGLQPPDGDKGGKKGGRKGRSAADELMQDAESLANMLAAADPVRQLNQQFIQSLAEQGKLLLNADGFKKFAERLKADAADGAVSIESLTQTLGESGTTSATMLKALKDRYGLTLQDIVEMIGKQQHQFNIEANEAIIGGLDLKYAQVKDFIEAFGDGIPRVQALGEAIDQLTPIAKNALSPTDFKDFMDELKSGSLDAGSAIDDLREKVLDAAVSNKAFKDTLDQMGLTAEDAAAQIDKVGVALARSQADAKIDSQFGGRLLFDMDQEITMLRVREQHRDRIQALTDAVRNSNETVTPEMLANLDKEYQKRQLVADALKRQNEFLENNGIRSYINEVQQAGTAINELDRNVLQSLEDQLFSLGTTGEFSFNQIFDTIQQGLVRFASQGIVQSLMQSLFDPAELESGTPSLFAGLFKSMGFEYKADGPPLGSNPANRLFVEVVNAQALGINTVTGALTTGKEGLVGVDGVMAGSSLYRPGGEGVAGAAQAATDKTVTTVAENTATTFGSTMTSLFPMIGMAFASSFKSPIAQIGAMLVSMILPKLMGGAGGGGGGGFFGGLLNLGMGLLGGGGAGPLASLAGDAAATIAANPGIFKEGGYPGSPVARAAVNPAVFANAPHYAEGTPNTSGGIPAILHDNEAVIPLSRGRKVPVEMSDGGRRSQTIVNQFNISTPDANSFKKSNQQIATQMHMQAGRAYRRNHG